MNKPGFYSRLFDIKVEGKVERCLCRDIQRHPVTDAALHVDFLRISADSKVHVHVPVHFANQDKSPGLKRGGVLNIVSHEVEIVAPGNAIPDEVVVDLSRPGDRRLGAYRQPEAAGWRDRCDPSQGRHPGYHRRPDRGLGW